MNRVHEDSGRAPATPYAVRSVGRVLDILDLLRMVPHGVSLADIARDTAMPKSTAFRYLTTLESRGYVERDQGAGDYRLGLAFLTTRARHVDMLAARARPLLEQLRDRFGETVNLGVLDGSRVVYLEIVESRRGMRFAARKGDREPLHSTALGKAIASLLDEDAIKAILTAEGMAQRTPRTITDSALFLKVVEEVRRDGYALDDRENEEDGRCVAVAIAGVRVPAALSLSAPAARFSPDDAERAAPVLREAAKTVARASGGGA
jgi:IclR family transcriptional regulator, acetate operon repressor